jgi:cell shape-determining protein MreD
VSAAPFGLHTAVLGLIGAFTALGESNLYRGNLLLFLTTAALATIFLHAGSLLGLQAAGLQSADLVRFVQFTVPTALLNALLMPLVFVLAQRFARMLDGWRQLEV